jgi:hypothetical protein
MVRPLDFLAADDFIGVQLGSRVDAWKVSNLRARLAQTQKNVTAA